MTMTIVYGQLWMRYNYKQIIILQKSDDVKRKDDMGPQAKDLTKAIDKYFEGKISPVEWDEIKINGKTFKKQLLNQSIMNFIFPSIC